MKENLRINPHMTFANSVDETFFQPMGSRRNRALLAKGQLFSDSLFVLKRPEKISHKLSSKRFSQTVGQTFPAGNHAVGAIFPRPRGLKTANPAIAST
jgi:hypothetical protein